MNKIIFSPESKKIYDFLSNKTGKKEQMILKAINNKLELIMQNRHYGNPISKKLIPLEYKTKYCTTNLFRIELPCFWRMLYTLTTEGKIEIIAFVLDIINHSKYNQKFGYKKK